MIGLVKKFCGLSCDRNEIGAEFYCINGQKCCLKTVVVVIMGREIEELVVEKNVIKYRLKRKERQ